MRSITRQRLDGRVAVVTGASRDIGRTIAQRLVAEGARVCITARKPDPLAEAAATMPDGGVITVAGKADDPQHRRTVFDRVAEEYGRLDVLVNNAGINPAYGPLVDLDLAAARRILEVNLLGTLAWVQEAMRYTTLGFAERGCVVNRSSVTGTRPRQASACTASAKPRSPTSPALSPLSLARAVRVNAVSPAVVKTDFARALYEGKESEAATSYPMKRLRSPDDVAAAVAYLVSDEASWITDHIMALDGGLNTAGGTA